MADNTSAESAGEVLTLIREGRARTRAELARVTGMSRSTVINRIEALLDGNFVHEVGDGPSTGGRPPKTLAFNHNAGVVLLADLGARHGRLAAANLSGEVVAERCDDIVIDDGPEAVITWVLDGFARLLDGLGRPARDVRGIGMGLPGPVEYSMGRAVNPPMMPGWDGVDVAELLQAEHVVPVLVDNDVNIMALGEYWTTWRESVDAMLFVKVATGIGSGMVANGRIYRGHKGAAGEMGHIQVPSAADVVCRCGNHGCLEVVASGGALARRLAEAGVACEDSRQVASLAMSGNTTANRILRAAGRQVGEVLAGAVNLLNPGAIVLGGEIALASNQLVAGVRERIYERSTALATHDLRIEQATLGDRAGITGAAVMITESILRPSAVDAVIGMA